MLEIALIIAAVILFIILLPLLMDLFFMLFILVALVAAYFFASKHIDIGSIPLIGSQLDTTGEFVKVLGIFVLLVVVFKVVSKLMDKVFQLSGTELMPWVKNHILRSKD